MNVVVVAVIVIRVMVAWTWDGLGVERSGVVWPIAEPAGATCSGFGNANI